MRSCAVLKRWGPSLTIWRPVKVEWCCCACMRWAASAANKSATILSANISNVMNVYEGVRMQARNHTLALEIGMAENSQQSSS